MHWLLTGHTGFKGSWLALQLIEAGHEVSGLALDPEPGALFEAAELAPRMRTDLRGDIRDPQTVRSALDRRWARELCRCVSASGHRPRA